MPALSRAALAAAQKARALHPVRVETPELGDGAYVCVKRWTLAERDAFESENDDRILAERRRASAEKRDYDWKRVSASTRARTLAVSLCDDAGRALYPERTEADIAELASWDGAVLERAFQVSTHVNALGEVDVDAIVKNSDAGRGGSSSSGSASPSESSTPTSSAGG